MIIFLGLVGVARAPSPARVDVLESGIEPVDINGPERGTHSVWSHSFA